MHFKYANIEKTFSIPLSERIVISHLMVFKTFLQVDHNVFLKIMTCKSPIKVQYLETVIKCVEHSFFTNRKVLTYIQDFENLKVFMSWHHMVEEIWVEMCSKTYEKTHTKRVEWLSLTKLKCRIISNGIKYVDENIQSKYFLFYPSFSSFI